MGSSCRPPLPCVGPHSTPAQGSSPLDTFKLIWTSLYRTLDMFKLVQLGTGSPRQVETCSLCSPCCQQGDCCQMTEIPLCGAIPKIVLASPKKSATSSCCSPCQSSVSSKFSKFSVLSHSVWFVTHLT